MIQVRYCITLSQVIEMLLICREQGRRVPVERNLATPHPALRTFTLNKHLYNNTHSLNKTHSQNPSPTFSITNIFNCKISLQRNSYTLFRIYTGRHDIKYWLNNGISVVTDLSDILAIVSNSLFLMHYGVGRRRLCEYSFVMGSERGACRCLVTVEWHHLLCTTNTRNAWVGISTVYIIILLCIKK